MQVLNKKMLKNNNVSEKNIVDAYQQRVASGKITFDPAQESLVREFQQLSESILSYDNARNKNWLLKVLPGMDGASTPKGLYIYSDVGRGKSMLMDMFFEHCAVEKKRRVHFHAFMMEVHRELQRLRQSGKNEKNNQSLIVPLAKKVVQEAHLLCFDEFQVHDIADAMILGKLFTELFERGVVIVVTSNRHPDELYKDGLQREYFLPFIALLKEKTTVVKLESPEDYRLKHLKSLSTTYFPQVGKNAEAFLVGSFKELTNGEPPQPVILQVLGRRIYVSQACGDVAMFSFYELCGEARGASDYIEIATAFTTVLISDIPRMGPDNHNEAKRFVNLVDELYEHKVKLICTAAAEPAQLYMEGKGAFEFERTVSRLLEMQSEVYLSQPHIA